MNVEEWQKLLIDGVHRVRELKQKFPHLDEEEIEHIISIYPVRINKYYLGLIRSPDDPIARQVLPDPAEIYEMSQGVREDPLNEEADAVVPGLTHRYPDRVLFYVNHQCPIYCRYCTRKRKIGDPNSVNHDNIRAGLEYIREHQEIRDVVLSGGDPLMLKDELLGDIVGQVRSIPHVEVIRIGTRIPSTLPQRVTQKMCDTLKKHHPIFIMAHFSHPRELTPEAKRSCEMLADNGFPLMNQTVLLKGINDDPETLKELFVGLLRFRVRPYYLYQADLTTGAAHFRTSLETGLAVMEGLRGHTSGLAVPYYVIDAPGGGGKIPMLPEYVLQVDEEQVVVRNYERKTFRYTLPPASQANGTSQEEEHHTLLASASSSSTNSSPK